MSEDRKIICGCGSDRFYSLWNLFVNDSKSKSHSGGNTLFQCIKCKNVYDRFGNKIDNSENTERSVENEESNNKRSQGI